MLHVILLVLCWIFVAIPAGTYTAGTLTSDYFLSLLGTAFTGTVVWVILGGIYHWVIPYFLTL